MELIEQLTSSAGTCADVRNTARRLSRKLRRAAKSPTMRVHNVYHVNDDRSIAFGGFDGLDWAKIILSRTAAGWRAEVSAPDGGEAYRELWQELKQALADDGWLADSDVGREVHAERIKLIELLGKHDSIEPIARAMGLSRAATYKRIKAHKLETPKRRRKPK